MALIEVRDLNYIVNNKIILSNINMIIEENSFIAIVGSNGSGKTTLLKLLCGILKSENQINYKDLDYKEIGIDFNDYNNFLFQDVYSELVFTLENMNMNEAKIKNEIIELCDYLEISHLLDKKCDDLNNAEKQLIKLAISIIHKPKVLILDNPFSFISNKKKKKLVDKLKNIQENIGMTIIVSSNNLEDIVKSDYTYVLDNGKVMIEGATLDVLKKDIYLKKIGLELPFSVNLSIMLNFYEIYNRIDIDYNEVIDNLWN